MQKTKAEPSHQAWTQTYQPRSDSFDEAKHRDGSFRPVWRDFLNHYAAVGLPRIRQRWNQAQTQIDRNGVTFNPYGDGNEPARPWQLGSVPVLYTESDWYQLSKRLTQRASVLEALMADLLGEQRLLKEKIIPPELLFGHPSWYPGYHNLYQNASPELTCAAIELTRSPTGQWWAAADRIQSPIGLGYTLENRIVTSRMLSPIFRKTHVRRIAEFYARLKQRLQNLAGAKTDEARVVIWTEGGQSASYFEDSYFARYLGYTLAESDDLAVREGRVQLLTLGGLLPVDVLMRRIYDDLCDSVELNPDSTQGISALMEVIREGKVAVSNSLGCQLLESPALMPFLPAASQFLLSEPIALPSVNTWWCGQKTECDYVIEHIDELLIRPAYRTAVVRPIEGSLLSSQERSELIEKIRSRPQMYVGQEIVTRSTVPVLEGDQLAPWHMSLRAFLVATDDGYETLPGGLARVAPDNSALNYSVSDGQRSQDVWVVADQPVEPITLIRSNRLSVEPRRAGDELPSRVAENLFWLGRYTERAAHNASSLRILASALESENLESAEVLPLIRLMAEQGQIEAGYAIEDFQASLTDLASRLTIDVFDHERGNSLVSDVRRALMTATRVRDRISEDMWRCIDELNSLFETNASAESVDLFSLLQSASMRLSSFEGSINESMIRSLGWRFLDTGCRIERVNKTAQLISAYLGEQESIETDTMETLLRACSGVMTYRTRYLSNFHVTLVLDLLLTDTTNPRSLVWQWNQIVAHLSAMPGNQNRAKLTHEHKRALSMQRDAMLADVDELAQIGSGGRREKLNRLMIRMQRECGEIAQALNKRYLIHAGLPRHYAVSDNQKSGLTDQTDGIRRQGGL